MTGTVAKIAPPQKQDPLPAAPPKSADRLAASAALKDVMLHMEVILGRATIKARQLAALRQGDVFRLERPAGSKVDILLHPVRAATGEIVPRNGKFAVRISSVGGKQPAA